MAKARKSIKSSSGSGLIVLQWLTYAFWGWTLLFALYLVGLVFGSALTGADMSSSIPYAIAGSLVLLPISFACDMFYARREPAKKSGGSLVVMVIHAVIFALCGIGVLVGSVLTFVQMLVATPSDTSSSLTAIYTLLVGSVLYALMFVRTLNPLPKLRVTWWYKYAMLLVVGGFIVAAFAGPVAKSWTTRDDRDIASHLYYVQQGIDNHVAKNDELPTSLNGVDMDPAGKSLVERGLVTYKPEGKAEASDQDPYTAKNGYDGVAYEYRYQLCVMYKAEDKNPVPAYYKYDDKHEYSLTVNTDGHTEGEVCYKLRTVNAA